MYNQACKVRPNIINLNSNEPVFYPFSIKTSKCGGSFNNINVPDVVKDLNVKVFNLMLRTHIKWHETCKCECTLDASVCNNKQRWNDDKCRYECKELIDKGVAIKDMIGILVIVGVNVINHAMLASIWIMKIVSVNPLYLCGNHANGYIEEKNENKYLIFDSTDENKELLKKYSDVWSGINNKIKAVSSGEYNYEKDYMKPIKC